MNDENLKKMCLKVCYQFHVQSVTKTGQTGTVPVSTAICVLCFNFQSQNGTLGTTLDTRSILCFIHEKLSLISFKFKKKICISFRVISK